MSGVVDFMCLHVNSSEWGKVELYLENTGESTLHSYSKTKSSEDVIYGTIFKNSFFFRFRIHRHSTLKYYIRMMRDINNLLKHVPRCRFSCTSHKFILEYFCSSMATRLEYRNNCIFLLCELTVYYSYFSPL